MLKLTQEEYLEKCNEVHDNKYDYSLVEYKNNQNITLASNLMDNISNRLNGLVVKKASF